MVHFDGRSVLCHLIVLDALVVGVSVFALLSENLSFVLTNDANHRRVSFGSCIRRIALHVPLC